MAEKIEQIPVAAVCTDGGTQQRPIDPEVVTHYADLRKDGVTLPPIEVVYDEATGFYWLWDGFHRLEVEKALNRIKIAAHVRPGTQQEAVWLSYSANKAHGVPRPPGTVKRIIEQILCNPAYSQTPIGKIAEHVGASRQYVISVKNALLARTEGGREEDETFEVENPTGDSAKAEKGVKCLHPLRGEKIIVKSSTGKTYQQKSQEKREPPAGPTDADGVMIPELLLPIFGAVPEFETFANRLSHIKGELEAAVSANPRAYGPLEPQKRIAGLANMRNQFMEARPYLVCPACGGDSTQGGCKLCGGQGWLSRFTSRTVAIEMRNPQRKAHGLDLLTGTSQKSGEETK